MQQDIDRATFRPPPSASPLVCEFRLPVCIHCGGAQQASLPIDPEELRIVDRIALYLSQDMQTRWRKHRISCSRDLVSYDHTVPPMYLYTPAVRSSRNRSRDRQHHLLSRRRRRFFPKRLFSTSLSFTASAKNCFSNSVQSSIYRRSLPRHSCC